MRHHTILLACICSTIAIVSAVPLPANNQELDVLQIPLQNGKELDVLTLGTPEELAERNKRTVGLLRDLFPDITKQIDDQANRIISKLLRALGPTVLRTAIQGNSANRARTDFDADFDDDDDSSSSSSSSGSSGTKVSIELPTFSPEDSNDDNDSPTTPSGSAASSTAASDDNK